MNAVHYLQDELAVAELAIERDGKWPREDSNCRAHTSIAGVLTL